MNKQWRGKLIKKNNLAFKLTWLHDNILAC